MRTVVFAAAVLFFGCTSATSSPPGDVSPTPDPTPNPFAPMPDTSEGLVNVSSDLSALLENGELDGACDAWRADPQDRRQKLLCGKWMFFYESFGTQGVPTGLFKFVMNKLPAEYGMVDDSTTADGLPLGFGPGALLGDSVETSAYTCASCHFGQLPDGRYAVGAANHDFDYAGQILGVTVFPAMATPGSDPADHHPDALARIQPLLDFYNADSALQLDFLFAVLPLLGLDTGPVTMSIEIEGQYAGWRTGTMDFVIPPISMDDEAHTVSRIISLWGIPDPDEATSAGMVDGMLSWTGSAPSLLDFVRGFGSLGDGDPWPDEELEPLVDYIHSLRPIEFDTGATSDELALGEELFVEQGCVDCHNGPRGSGTRLFDYSEIGTDQAMQYWMDPDGNGVDDIGLEATITQKLKSPRLVGLWAQSRFLHNGSVSSLEELLCVEGPRPGTQPEPYGEQGHDFGCDLDRDDKRALISFLLSH